ncbi:MAG TPA: DUF5655 domain-containing protein [Bryobacteraceae bacterium]|jgi:hypothetical protein
MAGRVCYHCKQWVEQGEEHDCWTTTEAALTRDLSEDLRDAWDRLRETAESFGEQRIYASHKSIMFSRKSCYFFVRPRQSFLELCVFLGRSLKTPEVRRIDRTSKSKLAHFFRITHRDEVEAPLTDWLREAYQLSGALLKAHVSKSTSRMPRGRIAPKSENSQMAKATPRSKAGPAPRLDDGKQLARVRSICRSIPGTIEKLSHGEPTFFTPKRVFAMFANNHHGDGHVAAWLPAAAGVQSALIEEAPEVYFRPPYVGVNGWVGVELSKVDDEQLGALIREAFRLIDQKTAAPRRSQMPESVHREDSSPLSRTALRLQSSGAASKDRSNLLMPTNSRRKS